jgi:nitronate monooxygenase
MKTRITEMFGIEHPIIQGGMHMVGYRRDGGGGVQRRRAGDHHRADAGDAENLAKEIARCREMTDKPFGVNLTFLPAVTRRTIRASSR